MSLTPEQYERRIERLREALKAQNSDIERLRARDEAQGLEIEQLRAEVERLSSRAQRAETILEGIMHMDVDDIPSESLWKIDAQGNLIRINSLFRADPDEQENQST